MGDRCGRWGDPICLQLPHLWLKVVLRFSRWAPRDRVGPLAVGRYSSVLSSFCNDRRVLVGHYCGIDWKRQHKTRVREMSSGADNQTGARTGDRPERWRTEEAEAEGVLLSYFIDCGQFIIFVSCRKLGRREQKTCPFPMAFSRHIKRFWGYRKKEQPRKREETVRSLNIFIEEISTVNFLCQGCEKMWTFDHLDQISSLSQLMRSNGIVNLMAVTYLVLVHSRTSIWFSAGIHEVFIKSPTILCRKAFLLCNEGWRMTGTALITRILVRG